MFVSIRVSYTNRLIKEDKCSIAVPAVDLVGREVKEGRKKKAEKKKEKPIRNAVDRKRRKERESNERVRVDDGIRSFFLNSTRTKFLRVLKNQTESVSS